MARVLCANHNMVSKENSQIQSVEEKKWKFNESHLMFSLKLWHSLWIFCLDRSYSRKKWGLCFSNQCHQTHVKNYTEVPSDACIVMSCLSGSRPLASDILSTLYTQRQSSQISQRCIILEILLPWFHSTGLFFMPSRSEVG